MSEPYTPTTEQARRYWRYGANAWLDNVARDDDAGPDGSIGAEFDRWLDQVRAEVWDEGHSDGQHNEHEYRDGRKITNPYRAV